MTQQAYKLRDYQQEAVDATVTHFRKSDDSAVIVLPTGAGKSLVIAELARLARHRILVLTHVKELVEQNYEKYCAYGRQAGIYSAGLNRKETNHKVTFASIQSAARKLEAFNQEYSLVIIDECHRVAAKPDSDNPRSNQALSQYEQVITHLQQFNPQLKLLGLTATPYRLDTGWIYRFHYHGIARGDELARFDHCIYELPLRYLIKKGYLTQPRMIDAPITHYDFSTLQPQANGIYRETEVNELLKGKKRVTEKIIENVKLLGEKRKGIMIFAATVNHAKEIMGYLADDSAALITGETPAQERDATINAFKQQNIHYLVNVSVLTTGFDAPHVDMIALLRPTQSVSLYQQIVGRGLRLFDQKEDCLVIDYAGNGFDLYYPEVGSSKPAPDTEPVLVPCPSCGFANTFWGRKDDQGHLIEHFGRRCQGILDNETEAKQQCDFRFKFKQCDNCMAENDIAARQCHSCQQPLIDPDDKLKEALKLKNAMVIRCSGMSFENNGNKLKIIYHDEDGATLTEAFDFSKPAARHVFHQQFKQRTISGKLFNAYKAADVIERSQDLRWPDFVIARKSGHYWRIQEKIFDYQGQYRSANALS